MIESILRESTSERSSWITRIKIDIRSRFRTRISESVEKIWDYRKEAEVLSLYLNPCLWFTVCRVYRSICRRGYFIFSLFFLPTLFVPGGTESTVGRLFFDCKFVSRLLIRWNVLAWEISLIRLPRIYIFLFRYFRYSLARACFFPAGFL